MDIKTLRLLTVIAEHRSLAAAARALGRDPSAVSRAVAAAEAALGFRLFQRSTRRLAVTEEGARYLHRIAPLLAEFEAAGEAARAGRDRPAGTLRLTASVAFAEAALMPLLPAYRAAFPQIALELLASDARLDLVGEDIDLALRLAPRPTGEGIARRLRRTRYHVCAAPRYLDRHGAPGRPEALGGHECLRLTLPGYRDRWRFRAGKGEIVEVPVHGHFLTGSPFCLRRAACDGLGLALLPDWLAADDLAAGRLRSVLRDHAVTATSFDTGLWALYPGRAFLPRKVRVTLDFLARSLPRPAG